MKRTRQRRAGGELLCWGLLWLGLAVPVVAADKPIDFRRDIRPLLADRCLDCHGPDADAKGTTLRLDRRESAFARQPLGKHAIKPGIPDASELLKRLTAEGDQRMPPEEAGPPLSPKQIARIRAWIRQGAEWSEHWAYAPLRRPTPPLAADDGWARNPLDRFTWAALQRVGLRPAPEADRRELLRRVTFALTGLPPSPQETARFLSDKRPDAYERLVDRLLDSPRYAERMTQHWLDLARYADTHGYHIDSHRDMWRWREWVLEAFARNMPFDRFTIEQTAGDLLPDATLDQRVATGFHRNHMINFEGGAIAEEYRNEYVVDRVNVLSTVWLGQTMECCRCHDHKYDPLTQRDYYRLYAFFNNIDEKGLDGRKGNAEPKLTAATTRQRVELARATELRQRHRWTLKRRREMAKLDWERWLPELRKGRRRARLPAGAVVHCPLDEKSGTQVTNRAAKDSAAAQGKLIGEPNWNPRGRLRGALLLDGESYLELPPPMVVERDKPFSVSGWVYPTVREHMTVVAHMDPENHYRGWDLFLGKGQLYLHLIHQWSENAVRVRTKAAAPLYTWTHLAATYDGSGKAAGVRLYINGRPQTVEVTHDKLTGSLAHKSPLRIGARGAEESPFRGMIDDVRVYPRRLEDSEAYTLAGGDPIGEALATPADERDNEQWTLLLDTYLRQHDASARAAADGLQEMTQRIRTLRASAPSTMVLKERAEPRPTYLLLRGDYRSRGEPVQPGVPEALPPLPPDAPRNRLGLARWLVDPANPLTPRVTANRLWQWCWGEGIVRTPDNFGLRGAAPTHPQLLDYLAAEFRASGWDIKHTLRLIVTSATFRQSSRGAASWKQDPTNRHLARGPRRRLSAEELRDNALLVAGLLVEREGGPSVFPYQPPGLWKALSFNPRDFTAQVYTPSRGADLYRRSLYTFWKRSSPLPTLALLDAPNRETCTVRRPVSNGPLQALVLMNDPAFVEAARVLAERALQNHATSEARLASICHRALGRAPEKAEAAVLLGLLQANLQEYRQDPAAARRLLDVGDAPAKKRLRAVEVAAWTTVTSTILNLSETSTSP